MNNKIYSLAVFSTFGIKATNKLTGVINVNFGGKDYKIPEIKTESENICPKDIEDAIDKEIQKTIPLFFFDECFISEFKVNDTPSDFFGVKYNEKDKIDIVLKKKLKVKEIKFKDSNFKQYLLHALTYDVEKKIKENKDFTYKIIFDDIKSISNLFKTGEFGIKLNNFEDTNETPYNGTDKLNEGDEITVILDEKKIDEKAFSKFVFEYDEDIYYIEKLRSDLDRSITNKTTDTITKVFIDWLFKEKAKGTNQKVEFDVFKNDDNTPIKCNSNDPIPSDLKYFRIKLTKNILRDYLIKKDYKVQLSKKGCKFFNEDVLKSIEVTLNKLTNSNLLECFKKSSFIDKNIDKNMISIKNQDTSDTKTYTLDDPNLPKRIIIYLTPEAFSNKAKIKVVFSIKDVEKNGKKLKEEFKNKFKDKILTLDYGVNKTTFINQLVKIIPGITEGDIKLNDQPLPEEIKEGGEISIPVEKIPDVNFEDKQKPEETGKEKGNGGEGTGGTGTGGTGTGTGNNDDDKKKGKGYCGSGDK